MCGFAGFLDFGDDLERLSAQQRDSILARMGHQLSRRGPDDEQRFDDRSLSFVFRRLAIIDLKTGAQPIWNEDRTLFVAVNGEIFNYRSLRSELEPRHVFRTSSDAEVVLHLFEDIGIRALDRLIGMFSIVLWDTKQRRLLLARDRLGIKPLFYSVTPSTLIFGSELKALVQHPNCPRELNWPALGMGFAPTGNFIEGIDELQGGHLLECDANGNRRTQCWWSIDSFFGKGSLSGPSEYIEAYRSLFDDSVGKWITSDVPVGVFLSGVIDSMAIVARAAREMPGLSCFTVASEGSIDSGDVQAARLLSSRLGLEFHPILFRSDSFADDIGLSLETFEYYVWMIDGPRFFHEWVIKHELHRYAKTVNADLKVILLGQGADEFAGGYSNALDSPRGSWQEYLEKDVLREITENDAELRQIPLALRPFLGTPDADIAPFHRQMLFRTQSLHSFNLWHEDRTSSGQGVEARVPFLDHRLVELLASVPAELHRDLFWNKRIVREAVRQWVPAEFIDRPKMRFLLGRDSGPTRTMTHNIINRVFRDFSDKYLDQPGCVFSKDRLWEVFNGLTRSRHQPSMDALLSAMSILVFDRFCKGGLDHVMDHLKPPSPLLPQQEAR